MACANTTKADFFRPAVTGKPTGFAFVKMEDDENPCEP